MNISPLEYSEMLARVNANRKRRDEEIDLNLAGEGENREGTLHDRVEAECKRAGYYIVHSRMDRATTTAIGVPDFVIALPNGKTLWLEMKAKGGKLTTAQAAAQAWLRKLDHVAETIFSFERFLEIVKEQAK